MVTFAQADVVWDVTSSTYNGSNFVPVYTGVGRAGSEPTIAYAGGEMDGDVFHMGFQKSLEGTDIDWDVDGTALGAGTPVTLVFTKDPSDRINYIAMNADVTAGVRFVQSTSTNFTVSFTVVNPVPSGSGDLGAAFGMGIDISTNAWLDYGGSVFVADLCPTDVASPINEDSGAMILNVSGSNGVTATFLMYATTNWMTRVGVIDPSSVTGYFSNTNGVRIALPEGFEIILTNGYYNLGAGTLTNDITHGDSYCFEVKNSVWSAHDLGIAPITSSTSMMINKMQANVNFVKDNVDSCSLNATLVLDAGFSLTNKAGVIIDIGGASRSFTLDKKGKFQHGTGPGSCQLSRVKKTTSYKLSAALKKGSWETEWANYGLTNNVTTPTSVTMPVTVDIGLTEFTKDRSNMTYRVVHSKGTAK